MNIENLSVNEIIPYENNPRQIHETAVDKVAESIQKFGFRVPIIIDKNHVIVTGHTRYQACLKLGMEEVPCILADDLTEEQIKAFRIADNRVAEESDWNFPLLKGEIDELLDMNFDVMEMGFDEYEIQNMLSMSPEELEDFHTPNMDREGFEEWKPNEDEEEQEEPTHTYTDKILAPIYEPTKEKPSLSELFNLEKRNKLIERIEASSIPQVEKEFLKVAANRHVVFDYHNIAEYYAHSDKEMQELMEDSALVIIDLDKAIENGFVQFATEVLPEEEDEEEEGEAVEFH